MENSIYNGHPVTKNRFVEHISVIFIFSVLTVVFTFPVILDFTTESAGLDCYDKCHMIWRFWWTEFSFENSLDFYHSNYIFYPDGADIGGNLAYFTTFIGFLLVQFLDYTVTWNIIWFLGFVFGGYGCYLLANNFNKNYLTSIIAAIIFTFTTYHMSHSLVHIGLSMIVWLPLFVLFLFKLLEKQSKYYPIIGGIIFFLVSLTHLYYSVSIIIFSIIFFTIYVFREKKVSNRTFITNFSILLVIGLFSTSVLFLLNPTLNDEFPMRSIAEHIEYSTSLENLIQPTELHTTQIFSDQSVHIYEVENFIFLGYSVIFLSALAIIKYRQKHTWFWLLICGIFILMSLGPELKIFNESTGIILPGQVFYDTIPEWDELRTPVRFIVMANLALAVLVSYSMYGLIKNKFSSFKQQLILTSIIGFVILFEFSMIPYPTDSEPIPDIYEEIKMDKSKFAILPAPLGGVGDYALVSDPLISYHQLYHEKPIYGGHESRVSHETLVKTQTYFLNIFHILGNKDDVVKQDLATHGLSLFDHFDIKYVVLHKDFPSIHAYDHDVLQVFLLETRQIMSEILSGDNPIYEDNKIVVYKIPKPNSSEPFLLLGSGWHIFDPDDHIRASMKNSEILIINPTNSETSITLNVILSSLEKENTIMVSVNNEEPSIISINPTFQNMQINNLILKQGTNVITFHTKDFHLVEYGFKGTEIGRGLETTMGFHVQSISITG